MSSEKAWLSLRLEGPLQSWGYDSQYNRRNTGLMPTKSAIAGICCAALGLGRGSDEESSFLEDFEAVKMTAIAIPQRSGRRPLGVRRLQDYHTVQNTKTADGKMKDCHITQRQYLTDASFGILLEGSREFLAMIVAGPEGVTGIENPVWGLWLGRKSCIPSTPVLAGLRDSREEALKLLVGDIPLDSFTRQEDADSFEEGQDSLPDQTMSFATDRRMFSPRRVRILQAA